MTGGTRRRARAGEPPAGAGPLDGVFPVEDERAWLDEYDPRAFAPIAVTVDVVALTIRHMPGAERRKGLHVLLVRRGGPPFAGRWALPGGFVRPQAGPGGRSREEDLDEAAARELAEETGLAAGERGVLGRVHLEQLGTYGTPGRDPRMRVVSVAHLAFAPGLPDPTAGGDAAAAAWVPVGELAGHRLAFDHGRILADGLERARAKLEYTPLATAFADEEFTITELREIYEAVWGVPVHAANFHRKVLSAPGFVEDTGRTTERGGARGGRRARLYRAGGAAHLHPALLRPAPDDGGDDGGADAAGTPAHAPAGTRSATAAGPAARTTRRPGADAPPAASGRPGVRAAPSRARPGT